LTSFKRATTLAGEPYATLMGGMSRLTSEQAPITAPEPIVTPPLYKRTRVSIMLG
jgi:hypothetical protein